MFFPHADTMFSSYIFYDMIKQMRIEYVILLAIIWGITKSYNNIYNMYYKLINRNNRDISYSFIRSHIKMVNIRDSLCVYLITNKLLKILRHEGQSFTLNSNSQIIFETNRDYNLSDIIIVRVISLSAHIMILLTV